MELVKNADKGEQHLTSNAVYAAPGITLVTADTLPYFLIDTSFSPFLVLAAGHSLSVLIGVLMSGIISWPLKKHSSPVLTAVAAEADRWESMEDDFRNRKAA